MLALSILENASVVYTYNYNQYASMENASVV